jgi:hypothetical protein
MNIVCVKEAIKEKLLEEIENLSEADLQRRGNNTHEVKIKIEKIRKKESQKIELTEDVMNRLEK